VETVDNYFHYFGIMAMTLSGEQDLVNNPWLRPEYLYLSTLTGANDLLRQNFSTQLRKYRACLGISQAELSRKLGIAKTTVINWEKSDGRWQPSWEQIEEMCSWSGIKPLFFFLDEDFGSDYLDLAEKIKGLPDEVRESLEGLVDSLHKTK
jgi:transcriptional regulator with XRE-family HTH domain